VAASFQSSEATLAQLHALTWLCESALISSLTVLLAFLPTATMERYLQPGRIPAGTRHRPPRITLFRRSGRKLILCARFA
jgi:hypothetical protein